MSAPTIPGAGDVEMAAAPVSSTVHPSPNTAESTAQSPPASSTPNALTPLPVPTWAQPHDPQNLTHDHAPAELSVPQADEHTHEEEAKAGHAETVHDAQQLHSAAVHVDVTAGDAETKARLQKALRAASKGSSKAAFETEWSAEDLRLLVDAADNEQLLGLLAQLDSQVKFNSRLTFHHLTFTRNGVDYLRDVSGAVEPGKLSALIGAPDSGITLLLSLLAGRPPLFGKMKGEILFDGQPISAATRKSVGYVVKEDPNLPQMTVYETLHFSARLRVADESAKLLRFRTLLWMKMLGLSHTYSTVVGDALTRGVSGGERRRVSYGCEMVAGQSLVLADLPTNGLDSTSAFALIKNVTSLCRTGRGMLLSLVQPSPEIFELLDSITVMSKGAIIYSGPPNKVESYFEAHGFQRPNTKTLPDWVEEMSATPERFWVNQVPPSLQVQIQQQRSKWEIASPRAAHDGHAGDGAESKEEAPALSSLPGQLRKSSSAIAHPSPLSPAAKAPVFLSVESRKKSSVREAWDAVQASFITPPGYVDPNRTLRGQTWLHLTRIWKESAEAAAVEKHLSSLPRVAAESAFSREWNRYPRSFAYQLVVCFQRQALLMFRNKGIWLGNVIQAIIMGLIIGTLFYQIPLTQAAIRVRFGLFFFMCMFLAMGTAQFIPVHFSQRSTFYNQRQNGYYNSAAYYLTAYMTQLPVGVVETFLFSIIVYPLAGLQDGISPKWAYLWLVLLLVNFISRAWIMFLVSISPMEAVTQVLQPISMLLFSTFAGFLAPKSSIPGGWSWLYPLSFFTYALRGLSINEQYGLTYECNSGTSCYYQTGEQVLGLYDMDGSYSERWTDVENLVWFFISFTSATAFMYVSWQWTHTAVGEPPNFLDDESAKVAKERSMKAIERAASHARSQHKVDHKAYIEWRDLCYSVPIKSKETGKTEQRLLLDHTYGWAQPNSMVALMGASGAGKSTLMDVLALKKNFAGQQISGTVLVNGEPQEPISFSRIAGYVEQMDSHDAMSTVREAVEVSARLRLPSDTSDADLQRHVARVLSALGLTHLQHEQIGHAGSDTGVAPEVRKKVTIAVELIMNPSLLFLDEPTTGLDAPGALSVMKAVRELAREIAVVCTIHQPSAEIVNMFDALLLMKSGGQIAYFGH